MIKITDLYKIRKIFKKVLKKNQNGAEKEDD